MSGRFYFSESNFGISHCKPTILDILGIPHYGNPQPQHKGQTKNMGKDDLKGWEKVRRTILNTIGFAGWSKSSFVMGRIWIFNAPLVLDGFRGYTIFGKTHLNTWMIRQASLKVVDKLGCSLFGRLNKPCFTHVVDSQTLPPHTRSQTWFNHNTCESHHFGGPYEGDGD